MLWICGNLYLINVDIVGFQTVLKLFHLFLCVYLTLRSIFLADKGDPQQSPTISWSWSGSVVLYTTSKVLPYPGHRPEV